MAANQENVQVNLIVNQITSACGDADLTRVRALINQFEDLAALNNNAKQRFLAAAIWGLSFDVVDFLETTLNYTNEDYQRAVRTLQNEHGRVVPLNNIIKTNKDWYEHYQRELLQVEDKQQFNVHTQWLYDEAGLRRRKYDEYLESYGIPMTSFVAGMISSNQWDPTLMIHKIDPMDFVVQDPHGAYEWNADGTYGMAVYKSHPANLQANFLNESCTDMIEILNQKLGLLQIGEHFILHELPLLPQNEAAAQEQQAPGALYENPHIMFPPPLAPNHGNQEEASTSHGHVQMP